MRKIMKIFFLFYSSCNVGLCSFGFKTFHSFTEKYFSSLNSTMGHSDSVSSLGIDQNNRANNLSNLLERFEDTETENGSHIIKLDELNLALKNAIHISALTREEIRNSGWNEVCMNEKFSLYKRRLKSESGPVEYLMMGEFYDVSPRVFLYSQIDKMCRTIWDKTMGDMSDGKINVHKYNIKSMESELPCIEEDLLYYRTRWPWPLKDRDYVLARRCKIYEENNAIVLVSKSIETNEFSEKNGAIRVGKKQFYTSTCYLIYETLRYILCYVLDNYWCKSAFISTRQKLPKNVANAATGMEQHSYKITSNEGIASAVTSNNNPVRLINNEFSEQNTGVSKRPHLTLYQRNHPRHRIKLNMLNKLRKKTNYSECIPPTSLYFLRAYRSNSCNCIENITIIKTNQNKTKTKDYPRKCDDVNHILKVDNSKNRQSNDVFSKIMSTTLHYSSKFKNIDLPGMRFVTIFCDDQKVPLPNSVTDILSKQGEKVVPGSIDRLYEVARELEMKGIPEV